MADLTQIQKMAQKLNLWHIARGAVDIKDEKMSNLDYLQDIFMQELEHRSRNKNYRLRKASRLCSKEFSTTGLNKGLKWQINKLSDLSRLDEEQNIIILGKCMTGKTSLSSWIGETAVAKGRKTYYLSFDDFIRAAIKKDDDTKAGLVFAYLKDCDLIIIDDVFYVEPTRSELLVFYKTLTFLNESRSIVLITNRELSEWIEASEDRHLCQTLLDRITSNSQLIRLTRN